MSGELDPTFNSNRREPFLDEASYQSAVDYLLLESIPELSSELISGNVKPEFMGYGLHDLASKYMDVVLLRYSAGSPISEMREPFLSAIRHFERSLACDFPALAHVDLAVQTHYVEGLWLLSLGCLLSLDDEQLARVADLYAADETNDGADELFERILAKLGRKSFEAEGLLHEDPYQLLLDCIKAEPQDRPALMTQFLKRWFKGQEECDWWGSHINRTKDPIVKTGFFGYWAFEAALVTYLWDIDDSSYRDLPHYPKDLADHARQSAAAGQTAQFPMRVPGGQPCPRTGDWFTPARPSSRRRFTQGEPMPEVGGAWGATLWQWDTRQD